MKAETEEQLRICRERKLDALNYLERQGQLTVQFEEFKADANIRFGRIESELEKLKDIPELIDSLDKRIKDNTEATEKYFVKPMNKFKNGCVVIVVSGFVAGMGMQVGVGKLLLDITKELVK